jgi:hypothetical protein
MQTENLEIQTTVLNEIRINIKKSIPEAVFKGMKLNVKSIADEFVFDLRTFLYGQSNVANVEYYENWWQELRVKLLPSWWLRKYPSRKKKISFSVVYPTLNYQNEKYYPIIFQTTTSKKIGIEDERFD